MYLQCIISLAMHRDSYRIGLSYGDTHPYYVQYRYFDMVFSSVVDIKNEIKHLNEILWVIIIIEN